MVISTFLGHAFLSDGWCLLWTWFSHHITSDWNRNWTPSLTDQWYLPDKWQRTWPRNRIWNNHTGLVILSACSSIYSKVEDNKTENKTHVDIKYEWKNPQQQPQFQLHQVLQQTRTGLAHYICCTVCLENYALINVLISSNIFVNGKFTEHFHSPLLLHHLNSFSRLTHVHHILLVSYDTPKLHLIKSYIQKRFICGFCFTLKPNFKPDIIQKHLELVVSKWWLYSSYSTTNTTTPPPPPPPPSHITSDQVFHNP